MKFTDDGWTGNAFRGGEGTLSFTTTTTVPAGYVWTYEGVNTPDPYGIWASVSGSFSLSTDSDQIFVYIGEESDPLFIFGLSTNPWVTDGSDIGTTDSVCPTSLYGNGISNSVYFSTVDNGIYKGIRVGTKDELLTSICNNSLWTTSDDNNFSPDNSAFTVYSATDSPSPVDNSDSNSENKFGSLDENEFIGIIVGVGVLIFFIFVFFLWKYLGGRGKGPLAEEDSGRDSIVEIQDQFSGHNSDLIKEQA